MLDWIMQYLMTRLQENRDKAKKRWQGRIRLCLRIRKKLDKIMDKTNECIPIKSDDLHYEVECYNQDKYVVDLEKHTCSCRRWELNGIPCHHAMSAICRQQLDPEDFVHVSYTVDTYLKVYEHSILPINGPRLWAKTDIIPPLPPNMGRTVGKPAKARRLEPNEVANNNKGKKKKQPTGLKKQSFTVKCKYCGEKGHNIKSCEARKRVEAVFGNSMETCGQEKESAPSSKSMKLTARKRTLRSDKWKNKACTEPNSAGSRNTEKEESNFTYSSHSHKLYGPYSSSIHHDVNPQSKHKGTSPILLHDFSIITSFSKLY